MTKQTICSLSHTVMAGVVVASTGLWLTLAGCETKSSQLTTTQAPAEQSGEVPEGYESWDDYWKDQDQREQAMDRSRQRHEIDQSPTVPR